MKQKYLRQYATRNVADQRMYSTHTAVYFTLIKRYENYRMVAFVVRLHTPQQYINL